MSEPVKLSHTSALILQSIGAAHHYGFDVMDVTGLPSGTVYPALRRLERDRLIQSHSAAHKIACERQGPERKYYKLTRAGSAALEDLQKRYPLLRHLVMLEKSAPRKRTLV